MSRSVNGGNFTHKAQEAIFKAQSLAQEKNQQQIDALHLFLALLFQEESVVLTLLRRLGADIENLKKNKMINKTIETNLVEFYIIPVEKIMLLEKLTQDLKEAMKAGNAGKVGVLRMLSSALKNRAIEKGKDMVLTDDEAMQVLMREAKKRKESIEAFEKGGRPELADKEKTELVLIEAYLPKQMSREEVVVAVEKVLAGLADKSNQGLVMKAVMGELKGKADGKMISEVVKEKLG